MEVCALWHVSAGKGKKEEITRLLPFLLRPTWYKRFLVHTSAPIRCFYMCGSALRQSVVFVRNRKKYKPFPLNCAKKAASDRGSNVSQTLAGNNFEGNGLVGWLNGAEKLGGK